MENQTAEKSQTLDDSVPDYENRRKRRSCIGDESPNKKTIKTNDSEDAANVSSPQLNNAIAVNEENSSLHLLGELCDEILFEIFKYLDSRTLITLMHVCDRFHHFVLDKRLWEFVDLSKEPLPLGILEDVLERTYEKTKTIKMRGPAPSEHIDGEIIHLNSTLQKSFAKRCPNLEILELYGITLDFNKISVKDFPKTLKRLVLDNCYVRVDELRNLFSGIENILICLEELAIEDNSWFDPYYIMPLSKLPMLRYLSLRKCKQLQEFIPYGSVASRHGFKKLEILDLRNTPVNDSDIQCFNTVENLKEMYLECPTEEKVVNERLLDRMTENEKFEEESPCTSASAEKHNANSKQTTDASSVTSMPFFINGNESASSSFSSSSSTASSSPPSASPTCSSSSAASSCLPSSSSSRCSPSCTSSRNIVPVGGRRSNSSLNYLSRPDRILYLDVRRRTPPTSLPFNYNDYNELRRIGLVAQDAPNAEQLHLPQHIVEQVIRHNVFWDIVNPASRLVNPRLLNPEGPATSNADCLDINRHLLSSYRQQQTNGTISDRGVCSFGRTPQPVQPGVVWIRYNNRPRETRFERFSVRDYKFVTDVSLTHIVQCSPNLIFLDVSGTSVTQEGVQRFRQLKPLCTLVADHLPHE